MSRRPIVALTQSGLDIDQYLLNKGIIDCSSTPNYPVANNGDVYFVSIAGKIGGSAGIVVTAGDTIVAIVDNNGGTQATVGSSWNVIASASTGLTGPNSSTDGNLVAFNGATGLVVKDSAIAMANIVQGPASAVGDNITSFNSTTGKLIKDSGVAVSNIVTKSLSGAASTAGLVAITATAEVTAPGSVRAIVGTCNPAAGAYSSGTLAGVRGIINLVSGNAMVNTYMYGVQGKLVGGSGGIDAGSSHICGMLAQMDLTSTTIDSGHIAPLIVSGQNLPASHYVNAAYFESGGNLINSAIQFNVAANFLFDINNFENCGIVALADHNTPLGDIRKIKIQLDGVTYHLLAARDFGYAG